MRTSPNIDDRVSEHRTIKIFGPIPGIFSKMKYLLKCFSFLLFVKNINLRKRAPKWTTKGNWEPWSGSAWGEGPPAGNRREGVLEDQCIYEGASMEEAHTYRREAWDLDDP